MARNKSPQTFEKRQRERKKRMKREEKFERRLDRRAEKRRLKADGEDPEERPPLRDERESDVDGDGRAAEPEP